VSDLVAWLTSILDEDEQRVRDAIAPSGWDGTPKFYGADTGAYRDDWGLHTYHVAPERVLADIAAKRAIFERLADLEADRKSVQADYAAWVHNQHDPGFAARFQERERNEIDGLRQAVRLLASAYADRPGYREEWRP